jgi:DNA-directed RNA polymerase II subunit RPB2
MIYDQSDTDMIDMLRASLEEAAIIRTRDDALDYIAKRGGHQNKNREARVRWATLLLEEDFLPHVSIGRDGALKKAYFVGYMVNRLLTAALGRATEDDRDYYGKKRLEMAGTLLASLFRQLFR